MSHSNRGKTFIATASGQAAALVRGFQSHYEDSEDGPNFPLTFSTYVGGGRVAPPHRASVPQDPSAVFRYDHDQAVHTETCGRGAARWEDLHRVHRERLLDCDFPRDFNTISTANKKRRSQLFPYDRPLADVNGSHGLCGPCRRLFEGTGDPSMLFTSSHTRTASNGQELLYGFAHWDIFWLEKSATNGCPLCLVLWNKLDKNDIAEWTRNWEFAGGRCELQQYYLGSGEVETFPLVFAFAGIKSGAEKQSPVLLTTVLVNLQKAAIDSCSASQNLSQDPSSLASYHSLDSSDFTWSEKSIEQVRTWLRNCCGSHKCGQTDSAARGDFVPERLLHVGKNGENTLRLVEGAKLPPQTIYATLSHCWGDSSLPRPYLLTKSRLQGMMRGIALVDLPKTFMEAVCVTRDLGVEYIWIDSLCIVQDSKSDWKRNAALMWKVYSRSYVNLSATDSSGPEQGLFRHRQSSCIASRNFEVPQGHDFLDAGSYFAYDRDAFVRHVDKAPVNKRAWVVQERILSPRIIHFCKDQLYWECQTTQASERFVDGFPERMERSNHRKSYHEACNFTVNSKCILSSWQNIIILYTSCKLTYDSDTLPAIAALARTLHDSTTFGEVYLAGLWKSNLMDQLLWSSQIGCMRPKYYRVPSWSWASINGPISPNFNCSTAHSSPPYDQDHSKSLAKLLDACTNSEEDHYMSISRGLLRLLAPVWCVTISDTNVNRTGHRYHIAFWHTEDGNDRRPPIDLDSLNPGFVTQLDPHVGDMTYHPTYESSADAEFFGGEIIMDESTSYAEISQRIIYIALLTCWPDCDNRFGEERGEINRVGGLVLEAKLHDEAEAEDEQTPIVFSRVGVADIPGDMFTRMLTEMGNQELAEDARLSLLNKSDERLKLDDFVPKNWYVRDLPFIPQDYPLYDLSIE